MQIEICIYGVTTARIQVWKVRNYVQQVDFFKLVTLWHECSAYEFIKSVWKNEWKVQIFYLKWIHLNYSWAQIIQART